MSNLPRGTVTFAFTDIEGSTALLKRLADGYEDVIAAHRRIVRDTFTAHRGAEIDTQGDAFFFAFERASDAVAAAAGVQRSHVAYDWPVGGEVHVRVGLHTGEPTLGREGYLGLDVVRAARLCGLCRGGQVLLSETTRALVGSTLPTGVSVYPRGERQLKGIDEPERVYELEIEGVDAPSVREPKPAPASESLSKQESRERLWEEDFELRIEGLAQGLAEDVFAKLEESWGTQKRRAKSPDRGLDDFVAKANELAERIRLATDRSRRDPPVGES